MFISFVATTCFAQHSVALVAGDDIRAVASILQNNASHTLWSRKLSPCRDVCCISSRTWPLQPVQHNCPINRYFGDILTARHSIWHALSSQMSKYSGGLNIELLQELWPFGPQNVCYLSLPWRIWGFLLSWSWSWWRDYRLICFSMLWRYSAKMFFSDCPDFYVGLFCCSIAAFQLFRLG